MIYLIVAVVVSAIVTPLDQLNAEQIPAADRPKNAPMELVRAAI